MDNTVSLLLTDYVVLVIVLLISLGIGILFAVKDFRNTTRVEYLLGGRRMFMLPVALSVYATFTSGVSLIGVVTEVYLYGLMPAVAFLGIAISYILAVFTVVPLLYPLRLTSIFEYLHLRFHSVIVTKTAVVTGMFQTLCYMSAALLSPALVLQTAADLPLWLSVGAVGFVGTVYTAMGGIKSVIWTDAFQTAVMLGGVLTIIIKGIATVGGGETVWRIVNAGNRTIINEFSLDPRNRNTWWGSIFGTCVTWFIGIYSQSSLLRISSMRTVKDAKKAFVVNAVMATVNGFMTTGIAWVTYAYFVFIRCDPYKAGIIRNPNQISPYYVMHAMKDLPGFSGMYIAVIFSASLSTLSSGINALAANTVEDLLKRPLKNVPEGTATLIIKGFVFVYGTLIIGLAFAANYMKGSIFRIVGITFGGFGGPVLGIFLLGALFPSANKYGAILGGVISITFNIWIAIGSLVSDAFEKPLQFPPTDMCFLNNSQINYNSYSYNKSIQYSTNDTFYLPMLNVSEFLKPDVEEKARKFGFFLYDISYVWYGFIGVFNCLLFGMIVSYCTRKYCVSTVDEKLIFPFIRKFCVTRVPQVKCESKDVGVNDPLMLVNVSFKST